MGAVLGIGLLAAIILIIVIGLSPLLFVPVGIMLFALLAQPLFGALYGRRRGRPGGPSTPSTGEASYEPVGDPAAQGSHPG